MQLNGYLIKIKREFTYNLMFRNIKCGRVSILCLHNISYFSWSNSDRRWSLFHSTNLSATSRASNFKRNFQIGFLSGIQIPFFFAAQIFYKTFQIIIKKACKSVFLILQRMRDLVCGEFFGKSRFVCKIYGNQIRQNKYPASESNSVNFYDARKNMRKSAAIDVNCRQTECFILKIFRKNFSNFWCESGANLIRH